MDSSSEGSPDWIREFKTPDRSFVTLSLSSDTSPESSPKRSHHEHNVEEKYHKKRDTILVDSGDDTPISQAKRPKNPKSKRNHVPKEDAMDGPTEEDVKVKPVTPSVSSRMPLVVPDKVQRSKALVECDGDSIDLSGDVGAVGRIIVSNSSSGNHEMLLDLKGTVYKSTIVPSRTFCVVSVGQSEAKIEVIMNDFVRLEPQSNMFEAETMIEGTLDGFSFGSDEEGEKVCAIQQSDQNNENEGQASTKTKRKSVKSLGTINKKAKSSAKKTPKKAGRKSEVAKKTRMSKK